MKNYKLSAIKNQAGMTLIELTVVLLVLIGLAGLLIPYVSGFVGKTHDSTGTFNSAGLDNNIQRYITEKMRAPNNLESLVQTVAGAGAAGTECDPAGGGAVLQNDDYHFLWCSSGSCAKEYVIKHGWYY